MLNSYESNLLTRKQAANYLGLKESTLSVWATNKKYNLPYCKIGRLVKYKLEDLDNFIKQNKQISRSSNL